MLLKHLFLPLILLLGLGTLAGCAPTAVGENDDVTVSIAPLAYAFRAIAGDSAAVNVLTPDGASPETYQPTPAQLAALSRNRLYIRIGTLGFEQTQLERITANMPHLICVDAARGIPPLPDGDGHAPATAKKADAPHEGSDPHVWTLPGNMKWLAANICRALIDLDTTRTRFYTARLQRFGARMDSLDAVFRKRLATVGSRTFLIYHPALAYFARAYGLHQMSVQMDGKDPSAERMAQLVGACRREGVKVVFVQKEYNGRAARLIADEIGARVVEINPLSADWEGEMAHIIDALTGQNVKR